MTSLVARRALGLLSFALVITLAAASWAAGDPLTVVGPFTGDKKAQIRERFVQAIEASGIPVGKESLSPAADASDEKFKAAAAKHNVQAFILGATAMSPKGWTLTITVRNGKTGEVLGEKRVKASWLPGLLKKIDAGAAAAIAPLLDQAAPPGSDEGGAVLDADEGEAPAADGETAKAKAPAADEEEEEEENDDTGATAAGEEEEEEEEGDEEEEEEPEEAAAADAGSDDVKPSPLDVALAVGVLNRTLNPNDDVFRQFVRQPFATSFALGVSGGLYPGVFFTKGFLTNLGIVAGYETSLAGSIPIRAVNRSVDTSSSEFNLGARLRIPFAKQEFGMTAGFQKHSFSYSFTDADRLIPDVDYTNARVGADVRLRFWGAWGLKLQGAYRIVVNPGTEDGQIGNASRVNKPATQAVAATATTPYQPATVAHVRRVGFEGATAGGFDLGLDVQYWLVDKLAITAGGVLRHYYYDFHFDGVEQLDLSRMNPPEILQPVGGATDDYLLFRIGAELRL